MGDPPGLSFSIGLGLGPAQHQRWGLCISHFFLSPLAQGLTQTTQRHVDPEALRKMVKCAVQDYTYKGSVPGHPYLPEKYWLSQEEGRASPYPTLTPFSDTQQ